MAEHVAHPPRSERFIKAYLFVWGLLAAGGLTYLATLVWQPDWLSPPPRRPQLTAEAEPESALRMASRAIAEVRDVRRSVGDVQRSLGEIREHARSQRERRQGRPNAPHRARGARQRHRPATGRAGGGRAGGARCRQGQGRRAAAAQEPSGGKGGRKSRAGRSGHPRHVGRHVGTGPGGEAGRRKPQPPSRRAASRPPASPLGSRW